MCDSASHETVQSRTVEKMQLVHPAVMDEFLLGDRLVARRSKRGKESSLEAKTCHQSRARGGGFRDWSTSTRRATSSWTKKRAAIDPLTPRSQLERRATRARRAQLPFELCASRTSRRASRTWQSSIDSRETLARGSSAPSRRSRAPPLPDARATDVRLREPRDGPELATAQRQLVHPAVMDELLLGCRLVACSVV